MHVDDASAPSTRHGCGDESQVSGKRDVVDRVVAKNRGEAGIALGRIERHRGEAVTPGPIERARRGLVRRDECDGSRVLRLSQRLGAQRRE